jgi:hypothetical protein
MKISMLAAAAAAVVAVALPAQAHADRLAGVVVAKQHGTLVVVGARGVGTTVRAAHARARAGDRVEVRGRRLRDDTLLATASTVRSHTHKALVRGVAMRHVRRTTFLAVGRSIVAVHGAPISTGARVDVSVSIGDRGELTELETHAAAQAGSVEIEGRVVSVSPFVVSLEGLPITITVPAGITLPAALTAGDRIELTVQVAPGNVFTLVSIDELDNAQQEADEVEVQGSVVASTSSKLSVLSHGTTFTFAAPAGVTLPILPMGTFVEAKGVTVNGVLTLVRVKVEDDDGGGHDDGGGDGGHDGHGGGQ